MKKYIAIILMLVFCMAFAGCADNETAETNVSATQIEVLPTLSVDVESTGVVSETPMDQKKIIIAGKEYDFPFLASDLIDDGWYFDEYVRENLAPVEADTIKNLSDINLYHDEYGFRIMLLLADNSGGEEKEIRDCLIAKIGINSSMSDNPENIDIVLPGGITWQSTAADVVSVYGAAENNPNFLQVKFDGCSADYFGELFSVNFTFFEDGSIEYLCFY